jgi:hypothetical protein
VSRKCAQMLQIEMLKNPTNKSIINKFYPEMEQLSFSDDLPDSGKQWIRLANS